MPRPKRRDSNRERHREFDDKNLGDDPKRHEEILAQRWLGSPPPTFDRYVNALQQWSKLPGAVLQRPAAADEERKQ